MASVAVMASPATLSRHMPKRVRTRALVPNDSPVVRGLCCAIAHVPDEYVLFRLHEGLLQG